MNDNDVGYKRIISLSKRIRYILETSRQVQVASINASLVARRTGNVKGFQAVVGELKLFTEKLEGDMNTMSHHIFSLAQGISGVQRQLMGLRYHERAAIQSGGAHVIRVAIESNRAHHERQHEMLVARVARLRSHVKRSTRLCNSGRSLARAARVEAVYGEAGAPLLKQVAQDIEDTVHAIYSHLEIIGAELNGNGEGMDEKD